MKRPFTLVINRTSSYCGNCGRGADPREKTHEKVIGYFPKDHLPEPGCHTRWVLVTSEYGPEMEGPTLKMRPDLVWVL